MVRKFNTLPAHSSRGPPHRLPQLRTVVSAEPSPVTRGPAAPGQQQQNVPSISDHTQPPPSLASPVSLTGRECFREKRSHLALVRQSGRRPGQLWVVSSPRLRAMSTRGWAQASLAWAACSHSARNTAGQSHPQSTWCSGPDQNPHLSGQKGEPRQDATTYTPLQQAFTCSPFMFLVRLPCL